MSLMTSTTARSFEYWLYNYRRTWRGTMLSSALQPLVFLAAMGVGLGSLVDSGDPASLGGQDYLTFIAPGLLAATAMQVALFESTYPVMAAVKWHKTYHAMVASPLGPRAVQSGHLLWHLFRVTTSCLVFVAVMAAFGVFGSPWVALALPAAALTGMAFAAPVTAYVITLRNEAPLAALMRFGMIPMFLFSGTFFPVSQLPDAAEPFAYLTPLWHGVDLSRELNLGTAEPGAAAMHVAYLALWVVVGVMVGRRTYRRRLVV